MVLCHEMRLDRLQGPIVKDFVWSLKNISVAIGSPQKVFRLQKKKWSVRVARLRDQLGSFKGNRLGLELLERDTTGRKLMQ